MNSSRSPNILSTPLPFSPKTPHVSIPRKSPQKMKNPKNKNNKPKEDLFIPTKREE